MEIGPWPCIILVKNSFVFLWYRNKYDYLQIALSCKNITSFINLLLDKYNFLYI